jgi:hypothetical protein
MSAEYTRFNFWTRGNWVLGSRFWVHGFGCWVQDAAVFFIEKTSDMIILNAV